MSLSDLLAPPGDFEGESLVMFMKRHTGQLPSKVSEEPAVRRAEAAWQGNVQQDRDQAAMREMLRAKRIELEMLPSNTADAEERFARIQKLANLEYETEHFNG